MSVVEKSPDVEAAEADRASSAGRRFWGAVLVLDVVFLFAFGGSFLGLLYIRGATAPLARLASKPARADVPARAAPATVPVPGAHPSVPHETPRPPAPKGGAVATLIRDDRPMGSPAVHATALPVHQAQPLGSTPPHASAPAVAKSGKTRAKEVDFTHKASGAKQVLLRGPFLVRTGGKKAMSRDADGTWRLSVSLLPGTYRYCFIIDGKKTSMRQLTVE